MACKQQLSTFRLLTETFEPELTAAATQFSKQSDTTAVVEVGPRMSFSTAWSANAVSICHSCGLSKVTRMEKSIRYQLQSSQPVSQQQQLEFASLVRILDTKRPVARRHGNTARWCHALHHDACRPVRLMVCCDSMQCSPGQTESVGPSVLQQNSSMS